MSELKMVRTWPGVYQKKRKNMGEGLDGFELINYILNIKCMLIMKGVWL